MLDGCLDKMLQLLRPLNLTILVGDKQHVLLFIDVANQNAIISTPSCEHSLEKSCFHNELMLMCVEQ